MKPFRFPLQAVRILRQRQEHDALGRYGKAVRARQEAVQQLNKVQEQLEAGWSEWKERFSKALSALQLKQLQAYCGTITKRKEDCADRLQAAQRGVKLAWQQLLTARQDLEAVEHHYENERRRYEQELHREEQKLLDEMAPRRVWAPSLKPSATKPFELK
jgi:flagellar export protein FliJ